MIRLIAIIFSAVLLVACSGSKPSGYQGWVEADFLFVAPDESGRVTKLLVREGDRVAAGAPLYELDADLQDADVTQAQATLANAQQTFDRAQQLAKTGSGTQRDFDAAQSTLRVAQSRLNSTQVRLARRKVASPAAGVVQQVYFREGEMAGAGRPVVSLLPAANVKIRFYVPQADLPKIKLGDEVRVTCDGCASDISARVSFIASAAEYTPPVIYSQEERSRLVFLVQARPDKPDLLRAGQPVSVIPKAP